MRKDTLYVENIEEREDPGTPPIMQKIRAALAFRMKEWIGHKHIQLHEETYTSRALERLLPNPNICALGNTTSKRQAILSFLIYSTTHSEDKKVLRQDKQTGLDLWGVTRGKPLNGPFVAKLLNDIFGIQARGGCSCAGPCGHRLLNVDESHSLSFRSLIKEGYVGIKPGWTRVSFPYYMSQEEFEFILAAIEFVSVYGQRFLPLYNFNWRTGIWIFKKNARFRNRGSNTGRGSSLASLIKSLDLESNKNQIVTKDEVMYKYTNYLEIAKHIAILLPEFPPQRSTPEGIDFDFVPFRV